MTSLEVLGVIHLSLCKAGAEQQVAKGFGSNSTQPCTAQLQEETPLPAASEPAGLLA